MISILILKRKTKTKVKEENLPIRSGSFDTCPIIESDSVIKKRLSDIDCFALRYAAMKLVKENYEFEEFNLDVFDSENAFQDEELYLGSFEGIFITPEIKVRTLFLTTDNRICAQVEIETEYEEPRYETVLID